MHNGEGRFDSPLFMWVNVDGGGFVNPPCVLLRGALLFHYSNNANKVTALIGTEWEDNGSAPILV